MNKIRTVKSTIVLYIVSHHNKNYNVFVNENQTLNVIPSKSYLFQFKSNTLLHFKDIKMEILASV